VRGTGYRKGRKGHPLPNIYRQVRLPAGCLSHPIGALTLGSCHAQVLSCVCRDGCFLQRALLIPNKANDMTRVSSVCHAGFFTYSGVMPRRSPASSLNRMHQAATETWWWLIWRPYAAATCHGQWTAASVWQQQQVHAG
jgi:hypothetical protein